MRKSLVALLLLLGAAASMATLAIAQTSDNSGDVGNKLVNLRSSAAMRGSLAARQSPARAAAVSDSFFIGHSIQTIVPGDPSTYSYGPFHVGRGLNRPSLAPGTPAKNNSGLWTWDRFATVSGHPGAGDADSMQGWWPVRRAFSRTDGPTNDVARPWLAPDIGNNGNESTGGTGKHNYGVLGYWHIDQGVVTSFIPGTNPPAPTIPAVGHVAWCGVRAHGDLTAIDGVTGNPINARILEYVGLNGGALTTGTSKGLPGYVSQMDQFMYTDVDISSASATLNLSFDFVTAMSTTAVSTAASRRGWYQFDPTKMGNVNIGTGTGMDGSPNYISNTGLGQPADSFMVYIGAAVDPTAVKLASSGATTVPVYDLKRRWLSELLKLERPIAELPNGVDNFHKSGAVTGRYNTNAGDAGATDGKGGAISLAPFYDAGLGGTQRIRIVWRVKTNNGSDDQNSAAFSSGKKGAAYIDNVAISGTNGVPTESFDFESAGQLDNSLDSDNAVGTFRSTGKPPANYFHPHPIGGDFARGYDALQWHDMCGPPNSISRACNMDGVVMSAGDHDYFEGTSGPPTGADADYNGLQGGMMSPTINLMNTGAGAANANGMGIDQTIATASDDYYAVYDVYTGAYDLFNKGNAWTYGFQSYPAAQVDGTKCWGELRVPGFQIFNPDIQCLPDIESGRFNNLIATTNTGLIPDSLRLFLGNNSQCYRFVAVTICPNQEGAYFDNVSVLCANKQGGAVPTVAMDIWMFVNDAFPTNDGTSPSPGVAVLPGTAQFDTCGANLTIGLNNAPLTGDATRLTLPGDTMVIIGGVTGSSTKLGRVDMVFRIKPGVGNYHIVGDPNSGLRPVPTDPVNIVAAGQPNFWGQYLASPGKFSKGVHGNPSVAGPGGGANWWNKNVWNSARCDTADVNIYAVQSNAQVFNINTAFGGASLFMSTYHEDDPKYAVLGISHPVCFLNVPSGANNFTNIRCDGTLPSGVGYDPTTQTQTKEGSKIIPDGLLTPGAHVEYFFRAQNDNGSGNVEIVQPIFAMCPETTFVNPQNTEGSTDGHRWQEFSVLPDRWKNPLFGDKDDNGNPFGGSMACMLFVDNNDRRGNERAWVSVADSIGATSVAKRGAHNGWFSVGGATPYTDAAGDAIDVSNNNSICRYTHGGQPGSTWDMYGVKASESLTTSAGSLGGRVGPQGTGICLGKDGKNAPTPDMLRTYYKVILLLSGDLNSGVLGPFGDRGANDLLLINDFLTVPQGNPAEKKVFMAMGDGFVESEDNSGHTQWLIDRFGLQPRLDALLNPQYSYKAFSGNNNQYADLISAGPLVGDVYSVGNACLWTNDVMQLEPTPNNTSPQASAFYQNFGSNGPYIASVYTPIGSPASKFYESVISGWDIEHLFQYGGSAGPVNSTGRIGWFAKQFSQIAAVSGLCQIAGTPLVDVTPISAGQQFVDFMQVRNNPVLSGRAIVHFGLSKADRVTARVYDVSGRLVRTLADRNFDAGEHDLAWDGTDDAGHQMERGVYFTQVKYARTKFVDAKKITVLK